MRDDVHVSDAGSFVEQPFDRPPFLFDPVFVSGGIHLIFGRAGAGKTQLVLTIIRDLINGERLFGEFDYGLKDPGKACYFGVDMPLQMLQKRIRKMLPEVADHERFLVAAHHSAIDITTVREDAEWVQKIREFDPDILFLDTLHKIHRLDENTSQTVAQVYGHLDRVFGGSTAIGLVHHEGKGHPDPRVERDEIDRQRGSTAWVDDSDLGLRVKGFHNPVSGSNITISFPRVRFSEELEPITLEMTDETLLLARKVNPNAKDLVAKFVSLRPDAERIDIATWLKDEHGYSKNQAYRAIRQVLD